MLLWIAYSKSTGSKILLLINSNEMECQEKVAGSGKGRRRLDIPSCVHDERHISYELLRVKKEWEFSGVFSKNEECCSPPTNEKGQRGRQGSVSFKLITSSYYYIQKKKFWKGRLAAKFICVA